MPALFSIFTSTQAIGVSAAGFFLASTTSLSPFNLIPIAEQSKLSPAERAPLYGRMFFARGRPAFAGTALGGAAAFLTAYFNRPSDISPEHSRALLGAAGALLIAVPHTIISMVPIYKALADTTYSGTEVQAKERWNGLMKRFYTGNSVRLLLYATAYALGTYGLAVSQVTTIL
ncbi:hypothetical protein DFH08DRAFT_855825 [Mycena albidolilacea]|uniref:Uncharacterized protein n=1 Tax=Mycena albidolilacea TaxID=1033008 RepID=A0AAD7EUL7_9AGAR|nr:hypothetical protein DFH08DRAFT_855825 [Mycena albidolilacea]